MGLQNEIEEIYARVLRTDLERISRIAYPSRHWFPSTPFPSYFNSQVGEYSTGSTRIVLKETDYHIKSLILHPFGPKQMSDVSTRRKRRRKVHGEREPSPPEKFDYLANSSDPKELHEAFHAYFDEVRPGSIPLKVRVVDCDTTTSKVTGYPILQLASVDYVKKDIVDTSADWVKIKDFVSYPHGNLIDSWPEEIVLDDGAGIQVKYTRADIAAEKNNYPP